MRPERAGPGRANHGTQGANASDGDAFWARTGTELLTNHRDPNYSHGGTELAALLQPSAVPDQFALSLDGREHLVAGHTCVGLFAALR